MKTLALVSLLTVNLMAAAAVPTWDTLSFSDVDPWELNAVEIVDEVPVVSSGSFNA
jgi:hypothetical protein